MESLYQHDLAYIQAVAFGGLARGAAPEIVRRLERAAIPIRRVVEVGCGAGPLTEALVEAGFEVTGIEPSSELLKFARNAVPKAHFINASVYETEIPACESVAAMGEPLTYHAADVDADGLVQRFFERVADVLPVGGILIFDVIETGGASLSGRSWTSGEDWAELVYTTEDKHRRTLVRKIETFRRTGALYRRGAEIHRVRLFDSQILCHQLAQCGFVTETAQAYGEQVLGPRRRAFFATRV
jgi:SAM-dependent methyltransferase